MFRRFFFVPNGWQWLTILMIYNVFFPTKSSNFGDGFENALDL